MSESATVSAGKEYRAFISYSHKDSREAQWLHNSLENYSIPRHLVGTASAAGPVPRRLQPIFLDRAELAATADLDSVLVDTLRRSDHLIVVCSPDAAKSPRVAREIEQFLALHPAERVLSLVVDGRPNASGRGLDAADECFPPPLRSTVLGSTGDTSQRDPLAADIRPGRGGRDEAVLKLVAGILGLNLDELRQRDAQRRRRRWVVGLAAALTGMGIASALGLYAWQQRSEAIRQARTAQATADFIVNLFKAADPAQALGQTLLARDVIDQGRRTVAKELAAEPALQSRLLRTVGTIYSNLGLSLEAQSALKQAAAVRLSKSDSDLIEQARVKAELASVVVNLDQYDEAIELDHDAIALFGDDPQFRAERLATQSQLGYVYWVAGKYQDALRTLTDARAQALEFSGPKTELMAGILEDLGRSKQALGDVDAGLAYQREAAAIRKAVLGPENFWYGNSLNNIGFSLWWLGRFTEAAASFREAELLFRKVLGPQHPWVAISLYGQGGAIRDLGRYAEAARLLREAKDILARPGAGNGATRDDVDQTLGTVYGSLEQFDLSIPLLKSGMDRAKQKFGEKSSRFADEQYAYAIELKRSGRVAEAIPLIRDAIEITRADIGDQNPSDSIMQLALADALCVDAPNAEGYAIASQIGQQRRGEKLDWRRYAASGVAAYCDPVATNREANEKTLLAAIPAFESARGAGADTTRAMVKRLVRFYASSGNRTKAAYWRGQLATRFALPKL